RHRPMRLVPEDVVRAAFQRGVGPFLAEGTVRGLVEATGGDAPAVVEHLTRVRMHRHPPALGLTAEGAPYAPRTHLHLEPDVVRRGDDAGNGAAVVREVVLRERVQHRRVAARGDVCEIPTDVTEDADAEVRDARARHSALTSAGWADAGRSRRCDSSATSR